ncbi:MAG: hypothetical protein LBV43_14715 [Prevotella sp.]|nr:hypothetical protein [Prevotella sp.]
MNKIIRLFILSLVLCLFACSDDDEKEVLSSEKKIVAYVIRAHANDLENDIRGTVDEKLKTITLKKEVPSNKKLVATFDAVGDVFIGSTKQVSGETANDLAECPTYKVVAKDGSSIEYKLVIDCEEEEE